MLKITTLTQLITIMLVWFNLNINCRCNSNIVNNTLCLVGLVLPDICCCRSSLGIKRAAKTNVCCLCKVNVSNGYLQIPHIHMQMYSPFSPIFLKVVMISSCSARCKSFRHVFVSIIFVKTSFSFWQSETSCLTVDRKAHVMVRNTGILNNQNTSQRFKCLIVFIDVYITHLLYVRWDEK